MPELELTPEQIEAAELMAAGMGQRKLAEKLGISRNTLFTWRSQPKFSEAYRKACARAHRETIALVQRTTKKATGTLVKALDNPDANVAVRAALGLLVNGWKASEHYILDERVTALEEENAQSGKPSAQTGTEKADESSRNGDTHRGSEGVLPLSAG